MLWNPEVSDDWLDVSFTVGGSQVQGTVNTPSGKIVYTSQSIGDVVPKLKRFLGCAVMQHLPEQGLDEAFEMLRDLYVDTTSLMQLEPPEVRVISETKGRVVQVGERPALVVSEEDLNG